jgi:hypothetical protein
MSQATTRVCSSATSARASAAAMSATLAAKLDAENQAEGDGPGRLEGPECRRVPRRPQRRWAAHAGGDFSCLRCAPVATLDLEVGPEVPGGEGEPLRIPGS